MTFEEEYQGVLQNIETAIIMIYRQHPDLTDYDVEVAVNALVKGYQSDNWQTDLPTVRQSLHDIVKSTCEWRLGRAPFPFGDAPEELTEVSPLTEKEIIACLRRIQKSIKKWTKHYGRQGYLQFVNDFIP